ncbi:MAG: hypothetical protein MUO89_02735 [Dehalococcoidia bacterium]|nr:hypothetical protein [Dehalococcoidia bacterium]
MDIKEVKNQKSKIINGFANKVGEVIAASSAEFTAQCYKLDQAPSLGSLVKIQDKLGEIYGVVYNVETHSLQPGRRVVARGENLKAETEIFEANPQISRLLTTDFRVLVVGHVQGKSWHHYLPPKSAPIHSFVYTCQPEEVRAFTKSLDFLSLLVNARIPVPVDEVIGACIRFAGQAHHDPDAFLVKAGKELACMLSRDVLRLNSLLKRLR